MLILAGVLALASCQNFFREVGTGPLDPLGLMDVPAQDTPTIDPTGGLGVGEACEDGVADCRAGLLCIDEACMAVGTSLTGNPCMLSAECSSGLICGLEGSCRADGETAEGGPCVRPSDCVKGLACATLGFFGTCVPSGEGDLDDPCVVAQDCLAGLFCNEGGQCATSSAFFGYEPWAGTDCTASQTDDGPPRVFFEIPRGNPGEFFRLPFPNDIRIDGDGHVDLSGLPTPGRTFGGADPVAGLIAAAAHDQVGASAAPAVYFRFSANMSLGSLHGNTKDEVPPTVRFVNIDPDSSGYSYGQSFSWSATDGGSGYICPRWLAVRAAREKPLEAGTTFAVLLTQGVATSDGTMFGRDTDFEWMVSDTPPAGVEGLAAWKAYAPLRSYLDEQGIPRDFILAAAVFTTERPDVLPPLIRAAVQAPGVPSPDDVTLCAAGVLSPCDDGLPGELHVRGCLGDDASRHEIHMLLDLPIVQTGERPYASVVQGGAVERNGDGSVSLQGTEKVCVSLTIPSALPMPEGGWPVVVYGHDTGETFRSAADVLGSSVVDGVAVLSWDGPMHGTRRGSEHHPLPLYYNFANPLASRGNAYQGAADIFEMVRSLGQLAWDAETSPTGQSIVLDTTRVAYVGQGQGVAIGALAVPYEPGIHMVMWGRATAGLVGLLRERTSPVDAHVGLALGLEEFNDETLAEVSAVHPALQLLQAYYSPVDPLSQLRFQLKSPLGDDARRHTLVAQAMGDKAAPPSPAKLFTRLLGAPLTVPVLESVKGLEELEPPITGNLGSEAQPVTAGVLQIETSGAQDHPFALEDAGARAQWRAFIATWAASGVPTIVPRPDDPEDP